MSAELLAGPFLDFGTSYWNSPLMLREHPGLASRGFEPQGRFGIGFFSVFMWGEHVKVVTRQHEQGIESTRVLEFGKGLSCRPILRHADAEERLRDPGTRVQVQLEKRATDSGGVLGPGPIESRFRFSDMARREKAWSLKDLCAWLCPAIDVSLMVEQEGTPEVSVTAADWETMDGSDLLRRLLLHRDDIDRICADNSLHNLAANLRGIRDESGELLGRVALKRFMLGGSLEDPLAQASAATAGSFRAFEQIEMVGLLLGRPERLSRIMARPMAFDCPEALSRWATEQSDLVPRLTEDRMMLGNYALLIRLLGGDTRGLPIARSTAGVHSFHDIARRRDLPSEVLLYEEYWGSFSHQELPENGIAVATGRMKALYDIMPEEDPKRRADHPRWKQYWMSLWGATMEAIALAWGVSLQEVLGASEIGRETPGDTSSEDCRGSISMKVDKIRNPRGKDAAQAAASTR